MPAGAPAASRRRTSCAAMIGRRPRRLHDHGVAGDEGRAGHAGEDGEREVPRGDHEGDAARLVEVDVVLAGRVAHAPGRAQAQHLAPVVLEEVDRLVHVAVGLAPRLARLEGHERRELHGLGAHELGGAEEHGRALDRRGVPPRRQRGARRGDGRFGLGAAAVGDRAHHLVRRRRVHRVQRPRRLDVAAADAQRVVRAEAPAHRRQRRVVRLAVLAAREVGVRLVAERARVRRVRGLRGRQPPRLGAEVGRGLRRPHELVDRRPLDERLAQERVVGGVLEQAPHQVGHSRG